MTMALGSFSSRVVATQVVATDGTGDYTNIQDAIDALPATGGVVYVKEGTYSISSAISITGDNVSIFGAGPATIISTTANISMIDLSGDNCILKDFLLRGNNTGTSQSGVVFLDNTGTWLQNVRIENLGGNGIDVINNASGLTIISCILNNIDGYGIIIQASGDPCNSGHITGCTITNIGKDGVILSAAGAGSAINDNIITNNQVINCDSGNTGTYSGIVLTTALATGLRRNIISNNVVTDCDDTGILIDTVGVNRTLVHGNVVLNNTVAQITDNGTSSTLADNLTA